MADVDLEYTLAVKALLAKARELGYSITNQALLMKPTGYPVKNVILDSSQMKFLIDPDLKVFGILSDRRVTNQDVVLMIDDLKNGTTLETIVVMIYHIKDNKLEITRNDTLQWVLR